MACSNSCVSICQGRLVAAAGAARPLNCLIKTRNLDCSRQGQDDRIQARDVKDGTGEAALSFAEHESCGGVVSHSRSSGSHRRSIPPGIAEMINMSHCTQDFQATNICCGYDLTQPWQTIEIGLEFEPEWRARQLLRPSAILSSEPRDAERSEAA